MIVSKSVFLLFIFFTSTSFGHLENNYRNVMSRKNVRGIRDSLNKEFLEDLPLRRDILRQSNEKDMLYENLYDRRSFRTGTPRQTRIESRDSRGRLPMERSSSERSADWRRDNNRMTNHRERYTQERSRTFRNDGTTKNSFRVIRNQPRLEQREFNERSFQNRELRQRELIPTNQIRQRSLDNQERLPSRNNRIGRMRDQPLENRAQEFRKQHERNSNNYIQEHLLNNPERLISREIRVWRVREQTLPDIRRQEIPKHIERNLNNQGIAINLDNRYRLLSRENRIREVTERKSEFRQNHEQETPSLSRDNRIRELRQFRERNLNSRRFTMDIRGIREVRQKSEKPIEISYRDLEQSPSQRYTRDIRQHRERSLENRQRFLDEDIREIRQNQRTDFRDNRISNIRQYRERSVENRDRRGIRINDVRQSRERRSLEPRDRRQNAFRHKNFRGIRVRNVGQYFDRLDSRNNDRQQRDISVRNNRIMDQNVSDRIIYRKDLSRASLSRSDSTRQKYDARINSQESTKNNQCTSRFNGDLNSHYFNQRRTPLNHFTRVSTLQERDEVATRQSILMDRNSIERRMVPIAEYTPIARRAFDKIDEDRIINKLYACTNIAQVILGIYLIGQILAHSSKKSAFGFHKVLPFMNSFKQKIE